MKIAVILPAAGKSTRFGNSGQSKLEVDLEGKPVFMRALQLFADRSEVGQIILAVDPDRVDDFQMRWGDQLGFRGAQLVAGGKIERWQTVRNALAEVNDDCTHVAIHDAARPVASGAIIDRVFAAAEKVAAVIPGIPISSTVRRVGEAEMMASEDSMDAILGDVGKDETTLSRIIETVDRSNLIEVQTPQVFEISLLRRGYQQLESGELDPAMVTDDACLVEALGETVYVAQGERGNIKITQPDDLELARAICASRGKKDEAMLGRKRLFIDDDDD